LERRFHSSTYAAGAYFSHWSDQHDHLATLHLGSSPLNDLFGILGNPLRAVRVQRSGAPSRGLRKRRVIFTLSPFSRNLNTFSHLTAVVIDIVFGRKLYLLISMTLLSCRALGFALSLSRIKLAKSMILEPRWHGRSAKNFHPRSRPASSQRRKCLAG